MSLPRTRVRRRVVACARCRTRKIVCDAAGPSCSKCAEAGVACVALNASKQGIAPRSIVQFLEDELANIDRLKACKLSPIDITTNQLPSIASNVLIDQVINDFTPSFSGLTASSPIVRCAIAGTRLPSTSSSGAIDFSEEHQSAVLDSSSGATPLSCIPTSVADFLFENYMKRVTPQNPIFYSPDIVRFFNSVFHHAIHSLEPGGLATPYEIYVVSLIMAISLTTSARTQQPRANSIAIGLFKNAMQHIQSVCTNDLQGLQALLLLCEYIFLNPSVANVWFISGFTTQMCIDLGLHQETPQDLMADSLAIDMRRRIFWCAYEMEIATSGALLRPTSFLSKHINVPFPSELEDGAISSAGINPNGRVTKFSSSRIWKFRQIEAEVVSILFHNGEITDRDNYSLDIWMKRMETAIDSWRDEVHWFLSLKENDPSSDEMRLYSCIARDYIIVTLFRPSLRVKEPTCDNLMKAFVGGVDVAKGYWKQSNLAFGNSKYVFHPCYHSFSSAVVFLQALERCKELICLRYSVSEIEDFIAAFSRFFATIAERWPAASRCLEEFERLMAPVKRKYIDFALNNKAKSISNELTPSTSLIDHAENSIESLLQLDDLMDFHTLFPHDVFNTEEVVRLPYTIPADWQMEFDFGII
ncbi:fungal-specific transcription factor domain-containing protein [Xylogone sp. PMI_703]|nr:fungal-specific transcription factor domain-containing protein [Xylogone sp. PMI_703]